MAIKVEINKSEEVRVEIPVIIKYGFNIPDIANKVLLGARPTDIPIEFPLKYILAVNLATANEIGIELPQSLVFLADVIVE